MDMKMQYLARLPIYEKEKAFSTDFPVDHIPGARRTNHEEDIRRIKVTTIDDPSHWKLDTHGFCFLQEETDADFDGLQSDRKQQIRDDYWYQIEAVLHKHFPHYNRIEAFDLTLRKRDPDFPKVVRLYVEDHEQPATQPHCDYSRGGGYLVLSHIFPGQEDYWKDKNFDILGVWRPLKEPTDDWPLAFCDYTSIDQENDILLSDSVRRDAVDEVSLLHYSENHRWYYRKNQEPDELVVFRNCTAVGDKSRAFHGAVYNPAATGPPRQSVEVRLVAFY